MATKWIRRTAAATIAAVVSVWCAGCGDLAQQGRSPVQLVIVELQGSPGDENTFGAFLNSDVLTGGTVFGDVGQVTITSILKDPGVPGIGTTPSAVNSVTITRYRVVYRRADGRNTPGVDVPFGFDGAVTFTIRGGDEVETTFELVRPSAKVEAPLFSLRSNANILTTIADVTFFGRDLAGNDVQATGSIQVNFANFADPE